MRARRVRIGVADQVKKILCARRKPDGRSRKFCVPGTGAWSPHGGDGGEDRRDRHVGVRHHRHVRGVHLSARSAILPCAAGGMILSSVPITAQLGSVFQAGAPDGVVLAARVSGR